MLHLSETNQQTYVLGDLALHQRFRAILHANAFVNQLSNPYESTIAHHKCDPEFSGGHQMTRIIITATCVLLATAVAAALAAAFSGKSGVYGLTATPGNTSSLYDQEVAVLTNQGISPARANQAIQVQSSLARTGLVDSIQAAMGSAFGGVWFEPATAQLHVGVTSPASRSIAERVAAGAGLASVVAMTPVRFAWAKLEATEKQWSRRLAKLFAAAQVETWLSPQSNALYVLLSSSVPSSERASIEREASTANTSIIVNVAQASQLHNTADSNPTECGTFKSGLANCNKTITSGVSIQNEGSVKCTAGPMAVPRNSKSETYLLTAGHCLLRPGAPGSKWYAFNIAGTKEPIGPQVEAFTETKGDYGSIRISNPGYWVETATKPVFADVAEWTAKPEASHVVEGQREPQVGFTNCIEGQTTGQKCGSIITKESLTVEEEGGFRYFVENVPVDSATIKKGDSGGPWVFIMTDKPNNPVLMEAMSFAGDATGTDGMPITKALSLLAGNLELLTKGNEDRP
jgi:streptogrisin C